MCKTPIIEFVDVQKRFGNQVVLDGLNLRVEPQEHVALIGPSGSGKSTILRLLMTLERPDSGDIRIEGQSLWHTFRGGRTVPADGAHLRLMRSKVGMVFQQFNLFSHMRVLRNVTEALVCVQKMSGKDARIRGMELLHRVGLAEKASAWPAELSGGQKQRVAIARALAMQPSIMLFDEITSALDPEIAGQVLALVRELAMQTDMTMLFVTHQMRFASDVAGRVLFFEHGKIIEDGTPAQVLQNPVESRTREFLHNVLAAS